MISIIVPVYNSEKTLKRCLESLIHQTYQDIEILLVIDGPTDSSEEIGKSYEQRDSRVKVIMKENEGVSPARNTGLDCAKGEYIQFVDSDDYISVDMCEKLVEMVDNSGAQMVLCGFHHLFSNRDIVKVSKSGSFILKQSAEEFLHLYEAGFLNMPWNKLFKREFVKERFDSTLSLGEDLLFNLDYMKTIEKIAVIEEPLYYYVQQRGQDTLSSKKRNDKYQIAVRLCEAVKEYYVSLIKGNKEELNEKEKLNKKNKISEEELDIKIKHGNQVIQKRLMLEFLDEIEGMAYDKTLSKTHKLAIVDKYMYDYYIQEANKEIGTIQIDYKIINYFLKRKKKHMVYAMIYIRKWLLNLLHYFAK
ncbi:MAG: glycosyltransferase family 2 protein [Lachnotalea sp.]